MVLPGNGIFVVRGEMSTLMTAMRRGVRWSSTSHTDEDKDVLLNQFVDLKQILNKIEDLRLIDPNVFLGPFLEVIRTEETTGAVTSLALAAVNKFLAYGLIDPTHPTLAATVESIADAVTHARFMGTDQASDAVTLMRVVEVLHTLMRSPEGNALTNESVCEVMLSCFKICFEPRLNELLRRTAEQALKDMVQLLFMRLPQFSEDSVNSVAFKKFKMIAASMDQPATSKRKVSATTKPAVPRINTIKCDEKPFAADEDPQSPGNTHLSVKQTPLATTPATPAGNIVDMQGKITQTPTTALGVADDEPAKSTATPEEQLAEDHKQSEEVSANQGDKEEKDDDGEYVNSVGVRFTQQSDAESDGLAPLLPYGLPCIQELFRFLILLCNPLDKQNTDTMMHMGLSLLTVAFEVGADNIGKYETLLVLVKDELCRNLFTLISSERLTIFAADLQLCFLLFESLRTHLKFQLECYLTKIADIIASDNPKTPYEMRELALDNILQLWRIPGFVAELYVNYDCDLYCTDLFENLTKLMSKNTLSATSSVYSTHILSMDALIAIIENIERNCAASKPGNDTLPASNRHSRNNSGVDGIVIDKEDSVDLPSVENISKYIGKAVTNRDIPAGQQQPITKEQLAELKEKKRIFTQGTELFNQNPDKGIQFLQKNGILNETYEPMEVAIFLRENPGLDKAMIGEYISKTKNEKHKILETFVQTFDFTGLRIDQSLRLYLETFRLPGEAPVIANIMDKFAKHWHMQNNEPFADTDAAFTLAYAVIMLNMDQHNQNAKRLNIPMTAESFCKNLRGVNGKSDFDQEMLCVIFNAIKNEEIIMPAERTGLVKENYLWKILLRRGVGKDGVYNHVNDSSYDKDLFKIIWGPSLAALSFMCDKSSGSGFHRTLTGFSKCASISSFYNLIEDFDALILTLCKFTTLLNLQLDGNTEITSAVNFSLNAKAQLSLKTVFGLVHEFGDCLRESWKSILEVILQLFRLRLLPKSLVEVEDFCEPNGKLALVLHKIVPKPEASLFSSLYSYLSSEGQREPTYEEQEILKLAKKCVRECQIDQLIQGSKFVQLESLQELLKVLLSWAKPPVTHKSVGLPYSEDITVFWMEFLVKVVIQNRDRMIPMWNSVRDQMYLLLMGGSSCGYDYLLNRNIVALLKLAIYLMRNEELCPIVLQSLKMFLMFKPNAIYRMSKQISIGIYELLKTSAQNIHTEADWQIIFTILECVGAGAVPPEFEDALPPLGTKSDGALSSEEDSGLPDRGYISESEVAQRSASSSQVPSPTTENWILVNKDAELSALSRPQSPPTASSLIHPCKLNHHLPFALFKCWDSLAFIVRNVAHITPYNFESCVRCIRTFVEACLNGGPKARSRTNGKPQTKKKSKKDKRRDDESSDSEDEDLNQRYETLSIQLLDLMYTLYTRTAQIFRWWAEEGCAVPQCSALWAQGWCPLLQGIARLAMDRRREVRTYAISCLQQRALLVHDLQTLSGAEWSSCFKQVLFPLLNELLPESVSIVNVDPVLLEESRIRTATIMSKVFLHHLTPLIELPSFNELWMEILDYIEKFMKVGSDMLYEQMLEILKNVLLVMHSVRVFHCQDGTLHTPLWDLTWKRIGEFLPHLKDELFRNEGSRAQIMTPKAELAIPSVAILPQTRSANTTTAELIIAPESQVRSSIILQPPEDVSTASSLILGQGHQQPIMPVIIPQALAPIPQAPIPQQPVVEAQTVIPSESQPTTPESGTYSAPAPSANSNQAEFSIELPETPSFCNYYYNGSAPEDQPQHNFYHYPDYYSQQVPQQPAAVNAETAGDAPNVPISHLVAQNQYPSLNKMPPNAIVQSFAPVYVQSPNQEASSELFSEYAQNPYNLTLQQQTTQPQSANANMFQPSNYFAGPVDPNQIPPGSEMLFGQP